MVGECNRLCRGRAVQGLISQSNIMFRYGLMLLLFLLDKNRIGVIVWGIDEPVPSE